MVEIIWVPHVLMWYLKKKGSCFWFGVWVSIVSIQEDVCVWGVGTGKRSNSYGNIMNLVIHRLGTFYCMSLRDSPGAPLIS